MSAENASSLTPAGHSHVVPVTRGSPKATKATRAVVVDIGTSLCKCGFAGDPWPACVVSSMVGKCTSGSNQKGTFVGQEIWNSSAPFTLSNHSRHDFVVDWNHVQGTLEHIFQREMKIQPEDHAALVSVPLLCPFTYKSRYAEMLLEGFHMPAIHVAYQPHLSMFSYGRTSALVVESGHSTSQVVPIYEGYILNGITKSAAYGGLDITRFLRKLLNESGTLLAGQQLDIVQDIKEKCCYASLDFTEDLCLPVEQQEVGYKLPDGRLLTVGKERFLCAEALFQPDLLGSQEPGLPQLACACLKKHECDIIKTVMGNILLCGGSTMMEGFAERFRRELATMCPSGSLGITAAPHRKFSVWVGGSILASLHSFQDLWISRSEYEEHGPVCIWKKCF
ncbi:actin-like protein 7A [Dryobates pubescens]|uniref:actin-like protein 7A n=1 Tax=Dryobates pubescens TaxID=118200 RepID=UPI0023B903BF|nr:actin-like protein 7A [Dryobates pubescens]